MGAAILVIVVGVLVGGAMAAAPQRIWWLTESWKFKNPEANEPSDAAYGMTRAGGVFVILLALFVGWSIIDSDFQRKDRREAEQQRKAAEAAFVAPPPQKRGPLPVIGYFTHEFPKGIEITVYYLAPRESVRVAVRDSASHGPFKSSYPCYTSAVWGPATAAPRLVNPELFWAPEELGAVAKSERCHPGVGSKVHETSRFVDGSVPPPVVTDSAIVDRYGTEILPAAAGNVVPKLPEKMYPDP
ncbi:hypothetical protein A5731_30455 [Mycolicibacterium conceptionense]|uniref:DUF6199 domain-containing protein n=2 Tax=Mycolicibacterium TaxID=1866885 RepID=A0A1A0PF47_9MYCO|nr:MULTISPECIES: DUF6199 family natural product biosynthesis protein [Mycolicibacterium]MCW1819386.1 hypothetical protein [Mycolicibacterium senegalense]OBB08605.1 hypothetical protein A5718_14205 [Mycolicibacterium conceptionense]OBE92267.1 hypothetical protein A5731_30455 [Mycolicibacterium conceptionense]OBF24756.1 hypothetical protein A5726_09015 [Mycolicibacterium conceptionense]OBF45048.1 hypothetical protein A5720_08865 [Mycolicibacterium conceptionense]